MRKILKLSALAMLVFSCTSCYSYKSVVGAGAKGNESISKWNSYVLAGLAPVSVSDSKQMAAGATDYEVYTRMTFVNALVTVLTGSLYAPTTTTVKK